MKPNIKSKVKNVVLISILGNIILTIIKFTAAFIDGTSALFSDGVNSLTDVVLSVIMMIVLRIAIKEPDKNHPYGHQKFESLIYFTIGIFVGLVSVFIIVDGANQLVDYIVSKQVVESEVLYISIIVAVCSLIIKLILVLVNYKGYKRYKSQILKADYFNHLSDLLASFIVLISVVLSIFNLSFLDSVASIIIGIIILKNSIYMIKEAISYLVEESPDDIILKKIENRILSVMGVIKIDDLKVRKFGNGLYVDVEISVDRNLSLIKAHEISEKVHSDVEDNLDDVLHVHVHVNPNS